MSLSLSDRQIISEKLEQALPLLDAFGIDLWLTLVRESATHPDPVLDLILGTHCTWLSALILTRSGRKIALVGSLDAQNIQDHAPYEVYPYVDSIRPALLEILDREVPQQIAINFSEDEVMADGLSHGLYLLLLRYLEGTPYTGRLVSSAPLVSALRGRKSPEEIRRIQAAINATLDLLERLTPFLRPGMTEKEVADWIRNEMEARRLRPAWDPGHCPSVFTGPESAGAHAGPTNRRIERGHLMHIDFGVQMDGYVSDLQRTWYFLRSDEEDPPKPVRRGFQTIVEAIEKAAEALKPGRMGWEIDAVAREWIVRSGYEEYPHGLGHQVGRKAHDGSALLCPRWERYGQAPYFRIEEGQVYTLEPRLMVPEHGIVTIEEMVQVTNTGCVFLSTPQKTLTVIVQ